MLSGLGLVLAVAPAFGQAEATATPIEIWKLDKVKVGDKVRFVAENANGAIVVTQLQPAH